MLKFRYIMFTLVVFVALAFNAINTVPVLADDAPPPTEATESETLPATEPAEESFEPALVSETPQVEPASDVEEETQNEPASDGEDETQNESASEEEDEISLVDAAAEETQDETGSDMDEDASSSVDQITSQLPEDTQLIVVNEEGETLPLASQEAANVMEIADPRWCPVGVTPGGAGCSPVFSSFNDPLSTPAVDSLIEWLEANPKTVAGVIWIEASYVGDNLLEGGPVILDGNAFGTTANFALTLNGGWSGLNNAAMNVNTPSTFEVPLSIVNWKNAVTIRNVVVENADDDGAPALYVTATGHITLINVDVKNNTTSSGGAILDNSTGTGNVLVNDSNFIENGRPSQGYGLQVLSSGAINLKNVSAIHNSLAGVFLDNTFATLPKPVTITGYNFFNHNGGNGLEVKSQGAITLYNITAMYNTKSGAELDNCQPNSGTQTCGNTVASNVVLYGDNNFSDNGWDGLRVYSSGTIITYYLTADGNGIDALRPIAGVLEYDAYGKGVFLHNAFAALARPISILGFNSFNGNASTGLFAHSKGLVTASNLTANDNQCDGSYDTNTIFCAGAYLDSRGVTINGNNWFVNNATEGLSVRSWGPVTLNNLYAEKNQSHGAKIETHFPATNTAVNTVVNGLNFFMDNGGDGLHVSANGVVTIRSVTAMQNSGHGVFVDNTNALAAPGVNITGLNHTSNNDADGVKILSKGAITISSLTSVGNAGYGAYLHNELPGMLGNVTVSGTNQLSHNNKDGLFVRSHGAVTLYNITAAWNGNLIDGGDGVNVDNSNGTAARTVILYGTNNFVDNFSNGLTVQSLGAITVYRVTANNNAGHGAYLDNQHNKFHSAVLVSGYGFFTNNADTGLYINSNGSVTTSNLTASRNSGSGVEIDNHSITINPTTTLVAVNVTMNGVNYVGDNTGGNGLTVNSDGAITISKITAVDNAGSGAVLDNVTNGSTGARRNIIITGLNVFSGNVVNGLQFLSSNVFSMTRFSADRNGTVGSGSGVTGTAHSNITLSCGTMNFNEENGYNLTSTVGVITLRGVYAFLDTNVSNKVPTLVRACP